MALMLLSSCSKDSFFTNSQNAAGEGSLQLSLSMQDPATKTMTKAAMSQDELVSSASVKIYKADFSGMVRSYVYSSAPQTIYLPADSYRVDVEAGEAVKENPAAASWDQKSYKGSKEFTIVAKQVSAIEVEAKVNNAVAKMSFDQSISELMNSGYTLTVGLDNTFADQSSQLVYTESDSDREGYYIVDGLDEPELYWSFSGTLAKDGSTVEKTGKIAGIEAGKLYKMSVKYTIKDGDLSGIEIMVDYSTDIVDDVIVFEPISTGLASSAAYEIWAGHATVHADVDETEFADPSKVMFAYSEDGSAWTTVAATRTSEGVYDAVLKNLAPSTQYTYKLVIDGVDQGESKTFTTDSAPKIPNGSFEYYSTISGKSYYKWYDPNCGVEEGISQWWGSGNGEGSEGVNGSASMGMVITYVDTKDYMDGNASVRAQSGAILGMLAAGNIFSGNFMGLVGTSGGIVNFGRPWTSRPTALRFWVKYTAGKIDVIKSLPDGVTITNDDYDRGQISVAIGAWDYKKYGGSKNSPIQVNTTKSETLMNYYTDKESGSTIANAELVIYGDGKQTINRGEMESVSNGEWRQVTLPLEYRSQTEYPSHVVISCASSMFGDYFTGNSDAKLWLDGFEFLYE